MTDQQQLEEAASLIVSRNFEDAADVLSRRVQSNPRCATTYNLLGIIALQIGQLEQAEQLLKISISIDHADADAHSNLGVAIRRLGRAEQSLACFENALKLKPDSSDFEQNFAIAYHDLCSFELAEHHYQRAIDLNPSSTLALQSRAEVLRELGRLSEALSSLEMARSMAPQQDCLLGSILGVKTTMAAWDEHSELNAEIELALSKGDLPAPPFTLLATRDDPELQRNGAEAWVKKKVNSSGRAKIPAKRGGKLKLGYFSADYHNHPSMHLSVEILEMHERTAFETWAFSYGPQIDDTWRKRAVDAVDHFIDVRGKSDQEIIELTREAGIDIAVDLQVFTKHQRFDLFAKGLAPIQVNFLAYPGTSGSEAHDYIVADQVLIPEDLREHYSEKVAYMPHSYQANCRDRDVANVPSRAELGLPEDQFVFCCFNQIYKLTPEVFDLWCRILDQVKNSVIWIWVNHQIARDNLVREAQIRGIGADRFCFANSLPVAEHLARLVHADLFLDTRPYNAHTSASDALRMGLPVLTRIGEAFASRVAASLLNAVSMPELITYSDEEYVAMAIELGNNPEKLEVLKAKLKGNLPTAPLFDSERYTRDLERLYGEMHRRAVADEAPDHIILD